MTRVCRRLPTSIVLAFLFAFAGAAQAMDVEEFESRREQLVAAGLTVKVEGRWSVFGRDSLKFRNCQILFRASESLPQSLHDRPNVEVSGTLVREGKQTFFRVTSYHSMPSDIEQFTRLRAQLIVERADPWYELAAWGRKRAKFYNDTQLQEISDEAAMRGFSIERRKAARDDAGAFDRLLERARELKLPSDVRIELLHEKYQGQWQAQKRDEHADLHGLANAIARDLPGAAEPLKSPEPKLRDEYLTNPTRVYADAKRDVRRQLDRIFWGEVKAAAIQRAAAPDGSNGFEIAQALDDAAPEFHPLAEEYRDRALALRAEQVGKLSRSEMLALRQEFITRQQPEQGRDVVESWLTFRRKKLDAEDIEGLLHLVEDYDKLLERRDQGTKLLLDAIAKAPESPGLKQALEGRGMRLRDGQWMTEAEFLNTPETRMQQALREGRVEVGMTADQVRKGLGPPLAATRFATAGETTEVWTYGQSGGSQLVIYLQRQKPQPDARVVGVDQFVPESSAPAE
ncbi:MAG TPA: hypothetical protein VHB77_21250 [Planctomycetaceae bacterium]|nr:hypothetical protein [Planctomycetaceae bacterium]